MGGGIAFLSRKQLLRPTKPKIALAWAIILLAGGAVGGWGRAHRRDAMLGDLMDDAKRGAAAFEAADLRRLAGSRDDLTSPVYAVVKSRLMRLRAAAAQVRFVYIFRHLPATGKVVYLADSEPEKSDKISLPGDDYPQAAVSPGLQEIIRTGLPATEGPIPDDFGIWVTGYALVSEAPAGQPGAPGKDILGMDISAENWNRELWTATLQWSFLTWVLLGLPFGALVVSRRQHEQRVVLRNLSEAMEQSHSAIMIVDLGSRIEYANAGLCHQIGYSRRELIGRPWRDFQVVDTPAEILADLVSTVRLGRPWQGEWFNRRKDGAVYPVRGVITPVKNRNGSLACFVAVFDDMTDMKRDEAILREARDRAEAGDRAKGQFLATMSHEVRTPLNGIVGFTGLLLETALNREQRDYVQTIRTSSEALIQLTGDILDFARIESGKLKLELQPCDPRDLVEDALDLLSGRAAEKNLELLHWVDAAVPAMIVADGGRLRQVLVILLNNAVKFTDAGEVEVRVTVEEQPDTPAAEPPRVVLKFTVRDTGIGIPVEQQGKLFKPFTQADESTTRRYGGTGLGLAISKNLVHLMNGDITLASEVGRGSTFAFSMQAAVGPAAPPSSSPLAGRRVALAARPGPLRTELAQLVTRAGAELIEADDPAGVENVAWDAGLIELDDTLARAFAVQPAPSPGLPPDKTCALVSLALPREVRAALKPHFRLLVNKPARHGALLDYLAGTGPAALPGEAEAVSFDLRVLLVEDNAVNQRLMQKVLSNLGCRFTVAVNGRLALAELAHPAEPYDLVLMDLHMPEMDGLTAITKIRGGEAGPQAQGVWLVALTADARDDQKERILTAGANDFLTKPLKLSELDAALRKFLAARKARPAK